MILVERSGVAGEADKRIAFGCGGAVKFRWTKKVGTVAHDYNEPVSIELPPEAVDALEIPVLYDRGHSPGSKLEWPRN
jgi:hypothetical protein